MEEIFLPFRPIGKYLFKYSSEQLFVLLERTYLLIHT